jgi:hypothetical protein
VDDGIILVVCIACLMIIGVIWIIVSLPGL